MKAVAQMSARELRLHLADVDHAKPTRGWPWIEMVNEHERLHRVYPDRHHEHDRAPRPEPEVDE